MSRITSVQFKLNNVLFQNTKGLETLKCLKLNAIFSLRLLGQPCSQNIRILLRLPCVDCGSLCHFFVLILVMNRKLLSRLKLTYFELYYCQVLQRRFLSVQLKKC